MLWTRILLVLRRQNIMPVIGLRRACFHTTINVFVADPLVLVSKWIFISKRDTLNLKDTFELRCIIFFKEISCRRGKTHHFILGNDSFSFREKGHLSVLKKKSLNRPTKAIFFSKSNFEKLLKSLF